jgi:hypothetical protein
MGYTNDVHMARFIPANLFAFSAGTWTPTIASDVLTMVRGAADASFTAMIPIEINSNSIPLKGSKLVSIDIWYAIGTAAADDFATADLNKVVLAADDTAPTAAAVATTPDAGHNTAAERLAVDTDHCMTLTLDTPAWIDDGDFYWVELIVDCAATTVVTFFGARANFTLRV